MINAKDELMKVLRGRKVECIEIELAIDYLDYADYDQIDDSLDLAKFHLKKGFEQKDWEDFLNKLNFEYPNEEECIVLNGVIWLKDGTWLEKQFHYSFEVGEPHEWWQHCCRPIVPDYLH